MNKKTKLAILIGAIAAVVSAVVVVIVFWDKLIAKFPCCCKAAEELPEEELEAEEAAEELTAEEMADYADVEVTE